MWGILASIARRSRLPCAIAGAILPVERRSVMGDDPVAMTTTCPSDDELADASAEHIDEGVITRLEHHLARCAGCRAAIGILAPRDASATAGPVDATALQPVDPAASEVRNELAHGGMGRILDAWDRQIGRASCRERV